MSDYAEEEGTKESYDNLVWSDLTIYGDRKLGWELPSH